MILKYRRKILTQEIEQTLVDVCEGISDRYEIKFIEIGTDEDHVHFLIQGVPVMAPQRIVQILKSISAKEIYSKHPEVRKTLWGGHFWTSGYYAATVGARGSEEAITRYVKDKGKEKEYVQLHRGQLRLI